MFLVCHGMLSHSGTFHIILWSFGGGPLEYLKEVGGQNYRTGMKKNYASVEGGKNIEQQKFLHSASPLQPTTNNLILHPLINFLGRDVSPFQLQSANVRHARYCDIRTIGLKNSHHVFIQSKVKPKPIVTHSHTFSRALRRLHVITSSFDWFTVLSMSFVVG